MRHFMGILRLMVARSWHTLNYFPFKLMQKKLIKLAEGYMSTLPADSNDLGFSLPLNALADPDFLSDPLWEKIYRELGYKEDKVPHRKEWEYTHTLYGLHQLGMIGEDKTALGVASGHERILYYLANHIKEVTATDLYEGSFALGEEGEANPRVLTDPDQYAPFPYRKDRLKFFRMDALNLKFADNSFDIIFCLSSIEHFGGKKQYQQSAREMARVLKPGGILALTTEFSMNNIVYPGYFTYDGLMEDIIKPSGLKLTEPFYLRLQSEKFKDIRLLPLENGIHPHFVLQTGRVLFTSVSLFLAKE